MKYTSLLRSFSLWLATLCGGVAFAFVLILLAPQTRAANGINQQINYQAKLLDSSGQPVSDGSYSVKFSLYDASTGGNRLWSATGTVDTPGALTVTVQNGLFVVALGDTAASAGSQNTLETFNWNTDSVYLGITVGSDSEMSPRKRLMASPQALNAQKLQGMYASGTASGGQNLFSIRQTDTSAATGTRTALNVSTLGTSGPNDYLIVGANSASSVFTLNRDGNVTTTGNLVVQGAATSSFSGSLVSSGHVSSSGGIFSSFLTVSGRNVCLSDGTNCTSSSGDTNWSYTTSTDLLRNATATSDIIFGGTATTSAPFFFSLTGASASSNRLSIGTNRNADLVIGNVTSSGVSSLFQLTGQDLFAAGNIGSATSVYSSGAFVAGSSATTYYGDGFITKTNGNITLALSSGYLLPSSDAGVSFGTSTLRFDAYLRNVTSTSVTTTNIHTNNLTVAGNIIPTTNNSYDLGSPTLSFRNIYASGTLYGVQTITATNNEWTSATGTHTTSTNFYANTIRVGSDLLANSIVTTSTLTQSSSTLVSTNNVGQFPSAVIGIDGYPILTYYYVTGGDLYLTHCTAADCSSTDVAQSLDTSGDVGVYSSIAIGRDGYPVIAYYDLTNGNLKFIHCTNVSCSSRDTALTLASTNNVGSFPSIAIGVDGYPIIAYQDVTNEDLNVIHCRSIDCNLKDVASVLDSGNRSGWSNKILIRPNGMPVILYRQYVPAGNDEFTYGNCRDIQCRNLTTSSIASYSSHEKNGLGAAIAPNGHVALAVASGGAYISFVRCNNDDCDSTDAAATFADLTTFPTGVGPSVSFTLGDNGMPVFGVYKGNTSETNVFIYNCGGDACENNNFAQTSIDGSSARTHASGTAMVQSGDGSILLFYYNATDGDLVMARTCGSSVTSTCYQGGTVSGVNIGSPSNYFFKIYGREMYAQQAYLSGFDLAESYPTDDASLQPGDVVAIDQMKPGKVIKADMNADAVIIGAVSTKPGLLLTDWRSKDRTVPVALTGRVPVRVSMENGPIAIGDLLTLSPTKPGVAMKASGAGLMLGRALEAAATDGLIEVFIQVGYDAGSVSQLNPRLHVSASSTLADSWGLQFTGGAWDGEKEVRSTFEAKLVMFSPTSSAFTIGTPSSTLFALDDKGNLSLAGDVILNGKRLYLDEDEDGRTYLSTDADGFRVDSSYDFAEQYYSPDQLEPGDLVVVSQQGQLHVQRSLESNQMLAGIVSTKPGFLTGKPASSTYPIALMGRVPAKVSSMAGSIRAGDFLAPSTIPGVAVKATVAGPVVGQALEDHEDTDIKKIEVFVHPMWWGGPKEKSEVLGQKAEVITAATSTAVTKTEQGFAMISAGSVQVHVSYPSIQAYPYVQVTPRGDVDGGWWIDNHSDTGFDLALNKPQARDVLFSWRVEAVPAETKVFLSDGTHAFIDPTSGLIRLPENKKEEEAKEEEKRETVPEILSNISTLPEIVLATTTPAIVIEEHSSSTDVINNATSTSL